MSVKDQFTPEEWRSLVHAPFLVSTAIGMSDPSGPFQMVKESRRSRARSKRPMRAKRESLPRPSRESSASIGRVAKTSSATRNRPPRPRPTRDVGKLREIGDLADANAGADAAPFKKWLAGLATMVAAAGKEGGFLGIGGESVSDAEETAIRQIESALA